MRLLERLKAIFSPRPRLFTSKQVSAIARTRLERERRVREAQYDPKQFRRSL